MTQLDIDRRPNGGHLPGQWAPTAAAIVIALLGWVFAGVSQYHNTSTVSSDRLTSLETHEKDSDRRLERIENKLDQVLQRVQ